MSFNLHLILTGLLFLGLFAGFVIYGLPVLALLGTAVLMICYLVAVLAKSSGTTAASV